MKEIGGYIELEQNRLSTMHDKAIALNCGRNCLVYLIRAKKIKKIKLPYFLCESVRNACKKEDVEVSYYHVNKFFEPVNVQLETDEWLYVVNYYGQLTEQRIIEIKECYGRVIIDNSQAYFEKAIEGIDTLYTCRKFFGVADGAFLYTDSRLQEELQMDESFERMGFLLGRFERSASEFYSEYIANNKLFANEPVKKMSKLTDNLLHGIDYEFIECRRRDNFKYLSERFAEINRLQLCVPNGPYAYPLWIENGSEIRKKLVEKKIFIPTLWPNVMNELDEDKLEYDMAKNILPIPVDQRYGVMEMTYIVEELRKLI